MKQREPKRIVWNETYGIFSQKWHISKRGRGITAIAAAFAVVAALFFMFSFKFPHHVEYDISGYIFEYYGNSKLDTSNCERVNIHVDGDLYYTLLMPNGTDYSGLFEVSAIPETIGRKCHIKEGISDIYYYNENGTSYPCGELIPNGKLTFDRITITYKINDFAYNAWSEIRYSHVVLIAPADSYKDADKIFRGS